MPLPDVAAADNRGHVDLHRRIHDGLSRLAHANDPDVARLASAIRKRHGQNVAAVLLYGSYLRGKRDTLLDFYVLLDRLHGALPPLEALGNALLAPNVYYLSLPADGARPALRAKYATLTLRQFRRAMDDFHSYFWSRFTQPAGLVYARDAEATRRVVDALTAATERFGREVAPMLGGAFTAETFWREGLALTYASELRSESAAGVGDLYRCSRAHFDALLAAWAQTPRAALERESDGTYRLAGRTGSGSAWRWRLRRGQGKLLSVLRLIKAAGTFDDPLDYLLWKIERHSGIRETPTERQRRHPLLFAWPLLWRLYRRGAFR